MRQAMMFSKRGTSSAEVDAAIAASIGGDQFDFVETMPAWQASNSAQSATANSVMMSSLRVGRPVPVTQMTYGVGTAAGTVDLGIYTFDGTNWIRQASTGPITAAGANTTQSINLTAAFTLQPGVDYWFALLPSSSTLTVIRTFGNAATPFKNRAVTKALGTATLPSTIAPTSLAGGGCPWIAAS